MTHNTTTFYSNRTATELWNQVRSYYRQEKENNIIYASNITEEKLDGRKTNIGCAMHQNRYYQQKVEFFDKMLQAINEGVVATVTEYYRDINKCVPAEVERWRNRIKNWSKPDAMLLKYPIPRSWRINLNGEPLLSKHLVVG